VLVGPTNNSKRFKRMAKGGANVFCEGEYRCDFYASSSGLLGELIIQFWQVTILELHFVSDMWSKGAKTLNKPQS
jgi:hypothetical protein